MKLSEIYKIADALAPKALSDEYCRNFGAYDNSGTLVDTGEEITGIVFSLDLTFAALDEAIEKGCNLIITHHPCVYGKINHARCDADDLTERKLVKALRNGISVISMHLNLDMAKDGIDESLMKGISLAADKTMGAGTSLCSIMEGVGDGGYGRCYAVKTLTLGQLKENIKQVFDTNRILTYGDEKKEIHRVASFCGAGADEKAILFAKENGADVVVSSDFKHHVIMFAVELGLSVIVMTHYASENYGFKNYYEKIRQQVQIPCVWHVDTDLL